MGFFSDLGKILVGKPLGQTPQAPTNQPMAAPVPARQSSGIVDDRGRKVIPHINLKDLRSHRNNDRFLVTAWVLNESEQRIRIDDTYLLKQKRSQRMELAPGQSHEVRLYDGPLVDNENEHQAWITYRLMVNGDVFMENFRIRYTLEYDGRHMVSDLVDDGPIRDM